MTTKTISTDRRAELAAAVRKYHNDVQTSLTRALDYALDAGDALLELKRSVAHGQWTPFVERECGLNIRVAQNYMSLARNRTLIEEANANGDALLNITGALQLIATPQAAAAEGARPDADDKEVEKDAWEPMGDDEELLEPVADTFGEEAEAQEQGGSEPFERGEADEQEDELRGPAPAIQLHSTGRAASAAEIEAHKARCEALLENPSGRRLRTELGENATAWDQAVRQILQKVQREVKDAAKHLPLLAGWDAELAAMLLLRRLRKLMDPTRLLDPEHRATFDQFE